MIKNIGIVDIDTASVYGPRMLRIQTQKSIATPCRMVTSTEKTFRKDLALSPLDELPRIKNICSEFSLKSA